MATLIQTTIAKTRNYPRLWIEGARLAREGLTPGMKLRVSSHDDQLHLNPVADGESGDGIVSVVSRKRGQKVYPLLELRVPELLKLFGIATRVVVKIIKGRLRISRHHQDVKIKDRNVRLCNKVKRGEAVRISSLYHGGGVLDCAVHEGLKDQGIKSECALVSEIDSRYMDASLTNNEHLFSDDCIFLNAPVEQVAFDAKNAENLDIDVVIGGVPCTGASSAGKARNQIKYAEQHASAGAQFYAFLRMIEITNPAIAILENVCAYRDTPSYAIVLSVLKTMGYKVEDCDLSGNEFGALESRTRMGMVAISEGLDGFDLIGDVFPTERKPTTLAEALEPFEATEDRFRDYDYLRKKEESDKKAGKGFRRQLLDKDAVSVPTITRSYNKVRSTDPQLKHPTNSLLTRLFTPLEHARIKGIPERIIRGISTTVAHEILGQSVIYPAFRAVAAALGRFLSTLKNLTPQQSAANSVSGNMGLAAA